MLKSDHPLHVRIKLWCLVWVNERQSWSKNLLHAKKDWWILVTHHALLKYTTFLCIDKWKKSIKRIWTISIWQIHKDHYQKFLSGHRIDEKFSIARFEIYIQTVFYSNSFLFFLDLILFVSYWPVTFQKR